MSLFFTGLSGLSAAQVAIQTIGNNLANASTPGYSRQRVVLGTAQSDVSLNRFLGGGVRVEGIDRITDHLLVNRVRGQSNEVGRRNTVLATLRDVEIAFGEPGEFGLSQQLTSFFNALSGLATAPDESANRSNSVQTAVSLAEQFRRVRGDLSQATGSLDDAIRATTSEINQITDSLAAINRELTLSRAFQGPPSELLDRQSTLLDRLSSLVPVDAHDLGSGRVRVTIGGQEVVSLGDSRQVFPRDGANGQPEIRLVGGAHPLEVRSGSLRGLLDLKRSGVGERAQELDSLASGLIFNFNRIYSTGVPSSGGFTSVTSENPLKDVDGNGSIGNQLIAASGLPFPVAAGRLYVTIVDDATGTSVKTPIDLDPDTTTVDDFLASLNGVSGLNASVDGSGRLRLTTTNGQRVHFGNSLPTNPPSLTPVTIGGTYSGSTNDTYTFRALTPGTIGATPGLEVEVLDAAGAVVTTLDVGEIYSPGEPLDVGDGVTVSFAAGTVDPLAGDLFTLDVVADSDSSDILVALGLNSFFVGTDASTIDVRARLQSNPADFAQGLTGAAADNQNILRLLSLRDGALDELGGRTIEEAYNGLVSDLGLDVSRAELNVATEQILLESFQNRLEQVRGVSIDEELADLERYQQSYQAAARFITAVNDVSQILFSI